MDAGRGQGMILLSPAVRILGAGAVALGMIVGWAALASACPACKEALLDPTQAQHLLQSAKGYALSIGLMLGMPLVLIGAVATSIAVHARRARRSSRIDTDAHSR